jgi:hypothetical protein
MLKKVKISHLSVNGVSIPVSKVVRDLGVMLDSSLSFTNHSLYRMLINSLVLSNLDYCTSLLYGITKSELGKLQGVINACLRCIYKKEPTTDLINLHRRCRWLNVEQRIHLRLSMIVFKAIKFRRPSYLTSLLLERQVGGDRSLRSSVQHHLEIPRANTNFGSRAFRHCGPVIWNALPVSIREKPLLNRFRSAVIDYLFDADNV